VREREREHTETEEHTHRHREEYDINTDLEQTCYEDVDWIPTPQG
jgi:hypothetical protein